MTISMAFIAPALVKAAVEGRLPRGIGVATLRDAPAEWSLQFERLGLAQPYSTSSHLQISDGVRIQQRQLLGEALATTPFRRQERDFLPQRLRSEIGRVPSRRLGDPKDALEKPAVSRHFRRVSTCRQKT